MGFKSPIGSAFVAVIILVGRDLKCRPDELGLDGIRSLVKTDFGSKITQYW